MNTAHHLHALRFEAVRKRALETAVNWAVVNATSNTTTPARNPPQTASPLSDSQLHVALLSPWVLGVSLQAIFMGVIASQAHSLYLSRAYLSWKTTFTSLLILCVSAASFSAQTGTLWYFSMSSLGDIRYIIMQFPLSLLVDLWLTPVTMATCNLVQARYAYQASDRNPMFLYILFPIWLTEVASSIINMILTTMSFRGIAFDVINWPHMSYLHLTSRLAAIFAPACLRMYYALAARELSSGPHSLIVETLGLIFRSGILGAIPAAIEAATVLQEKRFSISANVAYTCTPRVCASATLASFLYIVERKEGANAAMATYGQPKMQEIVCMPILNQTHNSGGEDDRIELV